LEIIKARILYRSGFNNILDTPEAYYWEELQLYYLQRNAGKGGFEKKKNGDLSPACAQERLWNGYCCPAQLAIFFPVLARHLTAKVHLSPCNVVSSKGVSFSVKRNATSGRIEEFILPTDPFTSKYW
jgi:hypothetical protein